jgi:hypothetical protein
MLTLNEDPHRQIRIQILRQTGVVFVRWGVLQPCGGLSDR